MRVPIAILCFASLLPGCGDATVGLDAYREGRFEDAHTEISRAVEEQGENAPARLRYNHALAALRAGRIGEAEASSKRAAAVAEAPEVVAIAAFLLGNVAFARCELAERQARTLEAEPFAFEVAIRFGEIARDAWQRAAMSRADWPIARRNVERALLMLESLKDRQTRAKRKKEGRPEPRPVPLPEPDPDEPPEGPETEPGEKELSTGEVLALFERLAEKEREKRALRLSARRSRMQDVERDW